MMKRSNNAAMTPGDNPGIPPEAAEKMKREGWPSIEETEAYWKRKEQETQLIKALDAFGIFFSELTEATGRLKEKLEALK